MPPRRIVQRRSIADRARRDPAAEPAVIAATRRGELTRQEKDEERYGARQQGTQQRSGDRSIGRQSMRSRRLGRLEVGEVFGLQAVARHPAALQLVRHQASESGFESR